MFAVKCVIILLYKIWAAMHYDCTNDYIVVCGPAGHYNKLVESQSESESVTKAIQTASDED